MWTSQWYELLTVYDCNRVYVMILLVFTTLQNTIIYHGHLYAVVCHGNNSMLCYGWYQEHSTTFWGGTIPSTMVHGIMVIPWYFVPPQNTMVYLLWYTMVFLTWDRKLGHRSKRPLAEMSFYGSVCEYSMHVVPALVWCRNSSSSSDGFSLIDCSVVEFDSLSGTRYVNQLMIKLFNLQLQITLSHLPYNVHVFSC